MERAPYADRDDRPMEDHVVLLRGAVWSDYQRLRALRGDRSVPRISFLEGTLEIMSPSRRHEVLKSLIGRLVEAYCLAEGIQFMPCGSWTLEDESEERGAEPDECYVFGERPDPTRPDLAIEVEWTAGRIDKLDIYRRLGVREVWIWSRGAIRPYRLRGQRYVQASRSRALPDLDLALLARFLDRPSVNKAIRDFEAARRRARRRR